MVRPSTLQRSLHRLRASHKPRYSHVWSVLSRFPSPSRQLLRRFVFLACKLPDCTHRRTDSAQTHSRGRQHMNEVSRSATEPLDGTRVSAVTGRTAPFVCFPKDGVHDPTTIPSPDIVGIFLQ